MEGKNDDTDSRCLVTYYHYHLLSTYYAPSCAKDFVCLVLLNSHNDCKR